MWFLGLLFVLLLIATPLAAFAAFLVSRRVDREVKELRQRLAWAEGRLARLAVPAAPQVAPEPKPAPDPVPATISSLPPPPLSPQPAKPEALPAVASLSGERMLTERWLVWLGGIALALGGAFLVKYSIDQGLLGPAVRVCLGILIGLGAIGTGHFLSLRKAENSGLPWHVPQVLVGAGAVIIFASLFAAYGLYGLIGSLTAFAALALTAGATLLLSLRHGPFVALLGLTGAFAVPLLVHSDKPSAAVLFTYLFTVAAGALFLLRWRQWWWLSWIALGGGAGWVFLWLGLSFEFGDEIVLGLYLCALFGLIAALRLGIAFLPLISEPADNPMLHQVVFAGGLVIAVCALFVIWTAEFSPAALALILALGIAFIVFAAKDPVFDRLPFAASALAVLALAGWDADVFHYQVFPDLLSQRQPLEVARFVWTAVLSGALFFAAGFFQLWRAFRPARWAALSSASPILILAVAYWRLEQLGADWMWALLALGLAAVLLLAAERTARNRPQMGMEEALGAYAIAVIAAISLAATFVLEEAWLTVSLSLVVLGCAWVETSLRQEGIRKAALVLAAIVLIRLALNPYVLDYPLAGEGAFNWLIYGYGAPALSFFLAARWFRQSKDDLLVQLLEAATIIFAVLLADLEIRHLMTDGIASRAAYRLAEQSLHSIAWLSGSALLFFIGQRTQRPVPRVGGLILLGLAGLQTVLLQALASNPYFTGDPVGENLLLNPLLLAYGAPAVLFGVNAWLAPQQPGWAKPASAALGLFFAFLWATLEVRHGFSGSYLKAAPIDQAELWVYSALYLLGSIAILAAGIRLGSVALRKVGLAILLCVVAKVFLVDLSELSGIWRAVSFLGLGAGLMGVGWVYRRFVKGD